MANSPVAVIDLGSNTCLLLIARQTENGLEQVEEALRVVRLGAGVDASGNLTNLAMDRAVDIFREYRDIINSHGCDIVRCVGTSAYRDAQNSGELRSRILGELGYELEMIDGEEEGRLVLRAIHDAFPKTAGPRWIVDVGGGSTEIVLEQHGKVLEAVSMGLGSVRHTERWLKSDPPDSIELLTLGADILAQLEDVTGFEPPDVMIGVGGTATTFVAIEKHLDAYDQSKVHGAMLTAESLQSTLNRLLAVPLGERQQIAGLHPDRAEIIIAGGAILLAIMERASLAELQVSDRGLRWGVAAEMADNDPSSD